MSGADAGAPPGGPDQGEQPDDPCAREPIGFWRFDDCNEVRTDLSDSSQQGHTAYRHVEQSCVPGQEGQAVVFSRAKDLVYAPDQPDFGLAHGATIATWVKPDRVDGARTLFRKRDGDDSAFALVISGKRFQLIARLTSGRLFSVSAPATPGIWTHVAGTYDRNYLRLYINGHEVDSKRAPGQLSAGSGPLLLGSDMLGRRLQGQMDNVWFNTLAAPADKILELTCVQPAPTLAISPEVGPSVPAGTPVNYQLTITSTASEICPPAQLIAFASLQPEFSANPTFAFLPPLAPGATISTNFEVTSGEETEPGSHTLTFLVLSQFDLNSQMSIDAEYVVAEPTGCHINSSRQLTIRAVSVVDDPVRTSMLGDPDDPRTGAWAFGRLMERLSPTPGDAPAVTEAMFRTFVSPQTVNGFTIAPREGMEPQVLAPWPRTADGKLDLARAPLRLLAIVNRLDLKDLAAGKAGEGRVVYGVIGPDGAPLEFTVIFEYLLPASTEEEYRAWVLDFNALQALPFPSEEYNAALQALTDRFTGRNAIPSFPNGSSLIDIRTNEIALSFQWELREFHISEETGFLEPAPIFQTPDASFNDTARLGRFINANEAVILTERHDVPLLFEGEPFQTGAVFNNIDFWSAPGITNPEARHKFSLNTCNGCHGAETNTAFLQIFPRAIGQQSELARFQTGVTVPDPETGEPRRLAELARRRALLEPIVCAP